MNVITPLNNPMQLTQQLSQPAGFLSTQSFQNSPSNYMPQLPSSLTCPEAIRLFSKPEKNIQMTMDARCDDSTVYSYNPVGNHLTTVKTNEQGAPRNAPVRAILNHVDSSNTLHSTRDFLYHSQDGRHPQPQRLCPYNSYDVQNLKPHQEQVQDRTIIDNNNINLTRNTINKNSTMCSDLTGAASNFELYNPLNAPAPSNKNKAIPARVTNVSRGSLQTTSRSCAGR